MGCTTCTNNFSRVLILYCLSFILILVAYGEQVPRVRMGDNSSSKNNNDSIEDQQEAIQRLEAELARLRKEGQENEEIGEAAQSLEKEDTKNELTEHKQGEEVEVKQRQEEEEARRRQKEEETRRRQKEEEEARQRQKEEAAKQRQEEEEARRRQKEDEEAKQRQEEEEAKQRQEEEEAKQRQEEEEAKQRQEEEEAKQRQEEEAKQRQEEEAKQRQEEEARRRQKEEEEARRREKEEEEAKQRQEEEEARRRQKEEETRRRQKEEETRQRQKEEEAATQREEEGEVNVEQGTAVYPSQHKEFDQDRLSEETINIKNGKETDDDQSKTFIEGKNKNYFSEATNDMNVLSSLTSQMRVFEMLTTEAKGSIRSHCFMPGQNTPVCEEALLNLRAATSKLISSLISLSRMMSMEKDYSPEFVEDGTTDEKAQCENELNLSATVPVQLDKLFPIISTVLTILFASAAKKLLYRRGKEFSKNDKQDKSASSVNDETASTLPSVTKTEPTRQREGSRGDTAPPTTSNNPPGPAAQMHGKLASQHSFTPLSSTGVDSKTPSARLVGAPVPPHGANALRMDPQKVSLPLGEQGDLSPMGPSRSFPSASMPPELYGKVPRALGGEVPPHLRGSSCSGTGLPAPPVPPALSQCTPSPTLRLQPFDSPSVAPPTVKYPSAPGQPISQAFSLPLPEEGGTFGTESELDDELQNPFLRRWS